MTAARLADLEAQVRQVKRLPSLLPAFQAFACNMPVAADERWISAHDWDQCRGEGEPIGPVYAGLDLSGGGNDLTSLAMFWPESGKLSCWAVIPAGRLDEMSHNDRVPYREWLAQGHVVACPGKAIDRPWLANWLAEKREGLDLVAIATDRWLLSLLQMDLDREGIDLPIVPDKVIVICPVVLEGLKLLCCPVNSKLG